jgi:hypothetical protein
MSPRPDTVGVNMYAADLTSIDSRYWYAATLCGATSAAPRESAHGPALPNQHCRRTGRF